MGGSNKLKLITGVSLLFICNLSTLSQIEQVLRFNIKAKLADTRNSNPVPFAHIYNMNLKIGAISDTIGIFSIPARYNDIILISSIGYYSKSLQVTDTLINQIFIPYIYLTEKIYELNKVDIHFLGTYEEFKYRVLHSKIPTNGLEKLNERIKKDLEDIPSHPPQEQAAISLGSPITGLYMLFSKEGKSLRKLADAKENEKIQSIIEPKYNRAIIEKVTGLAGAELDNFILFCQPDEATLIKADEFQIHQIILNYFERYKKRK